MKPTKVALVTSVLLSLYSTFIRPAAAQDAVTNGGFESGSFTPGWTLNDASGFSTIGGSTFAHNGLHLAYLGTAGNGGTLIQLLSTVPGQSYTVSFWVANDSSAAANSFQVFFDGASLLSLTNSNSFSYTNYTFAGLVARSSATSLQFLFSNDDDFFRIDDVSATAVVPEPGSVWLIAPALAGLALLRRRRVARFGLI